MPCYRAIVFACAVLFAARNGAAQPASDPASLFTHPDDSRITVIGQANVISQSHPAFRALYSGDNSLRARREHATSRVLTLSTRVRLTTSTAVSADIESAGGDGISEALGAAGFTNLDVVRNPTLGSTPYLARLLLHQAVTRHVDVTAGKLSTADFFDRNAVGSDSHLQFMNWTVDNNGAYDYAADTRGYTWGVVGQFVSTRWTLRAGEMLMPTVANGLKLDWNMRRARGENVEVELRGHLAARPTTVRVLSFLNHANMGDYRVAVARTAGTAVRPSIEDTRVQGRRKYGAGVNVDQQFGSALRGYARWGFNEPHYESFAYTEVNDTVSVGGDYAGRRWHRRHDKVGVAVVSNGISADHQRYLAAGGLGFLLGDSALRYGRESIFESYYTARVRRGLSAAVDVQRIANPGYNRDRGPLTVFGLRFHVDL